MNDEQIENREIWKTIKGAENLFEIYKYFPTLHDAKIRKINLFLEKREFYLTLDYSDLINDSQKSLRTRFTICWKNLQKADFNWYAEYLYGMKFSSEGDFTKTKFTDYSFGFDGEIIASEVEILNIEIEPKESKDLEKAIKFEIN